MKKKLKNRILKASAYAAGTVLLLSMSVMDAKPLWPPLLAMALSGSYLMLLAYANGYINIEGGKV